MAKSKRQANIYLPEDGFICFDNMLMSGISYVEDNYRIDRPHSDRSIIEYVLHGSGTVITPDGHEEVLSKGDVYYLPQSCNHLYYSNPGEQWAKIFVNFDGNFFDGIMSNFGLENRYVYNGLDISHELYGIFDAINSKSEDTEIKCAAFIFGIICKMHSHVRTGKKHASDAARLKEYIDRNFDRSIEISHLAKHILKSESQVIRIFKKEYGFTPHRYIADKRIREAEFLLKNTELSVKEISQKLCFSDEFYFSNAFKKSVGISPKHYREK